ncbi:MAG: Asparagine synthetase [Candidatus Falkowbacteria bacterium GW2011_GWC2_38_22]|uniref:asparagine synthase (glutamine-hydrolyzing) n=1 Tax=Candidatus Falkowbacteria bacterium GW2011_GWE1_38_31 TaxID=1618638 RepID=A0A0G0N0T5_9BACT|nr:MAG: Asparagine synthetase [Candidatus Falkowbacteria bacterium GW2011_GWF2_38_1205]KKQ61987.1 MAG: Asparagine synthetase [Candidatus Falkowbacteria bacterium GW2011_GWC2_38_22]KKQ63851.1 MAG: Asparagine synthetase [Candidatus Falkowbacteria bacterium GW2011_GWF1_38_22]KKQ66108.1 MAG: Asparagine synthetase [Candidatus Falkowbacteria bacterium GW2011_GWE2_38_254]KKQ70711.1 MAG: Asparagine synthetase [Candidatus Falkowbacteria bacterium GW2011_GWE1_38_31]KKQ73081.1 MAG: Asparagine synthetase 
MRRDNHWERAILLSILAKPLIECNLTELEILFRESIESAVKNCFELNDGKISTTLSGGVDSSFCLAMARRFVGDSVEIHTHTVGISADHPDIHFARMAAGMFGTIHHELIPSAKKIQKVRDIVAFSLPNIECTNGDVAVFMAYEMMEINGFKAGIAHDGIDEILGGYPAHRFAESAEKKLVAFQTHWDLLQANHLNPLLEKARYHSVNVIFPYLDFNLVNYLTRIPLNKRTTREVSKIPLREIAKKYLPDEIIQRKKIGFCSALDQEMKI